MRPDDPRWVRIPLGFPDYYRVQGPTFLIEYMNTNGNHSHSVWRDFQNGDFGEDLLRAHYAAVPHRMNEERRTANTERHTKSPIANH